MTISVIARCGLSVLLLTAAAFSQGGAIALYEQGTVDMGHAAAGAGARAQDAATVWFNPAGMTRLDDFELTLGAAVLFGDLGFDLDPGDSVTVPPLQTNDGGSLDSWTPLGGLYFSAPLSEDLRAGLALNGLYGGAVEYNQNWVGRTFVTEAQLTAFNIQPTAAWKATDWLSVGAGLNIVYTTLDLKLRGSSLPTAGLIHIKDADDWQVGGTFGVLIEPSENTRIGLVYRTGIDNSLNGELQNPTPLTPAVGADLDFAQGFNLSLYQKLTDEVALLLDVGWSDWSEFGYIPITVGPLSVGTDRNWRDTWRIGVGLEWKPAEDWTLRVGASYDSDPARDSTRYPDIPVGDQWRVGFGVQHDLSESVSLAASFTFMHTNLDVDAVLPPSNQVTLAGKYDPSNLYFAALTLNWRF